MTMNCNINLSTN